MKYVREGEFVDEEASKLPGTVSANSQHIFHVWPNPMTRTPAFIIFAYYLPRCTLKVERAVFTLGLLFKSSLER